MRAVPSTTRWVQAGLSIVELMIALALGLLIIGGILYTFISSRPVFTANDAVARIQEDGRIAMERLAREVRQAGYTGCANSTDIGPRIIADVNKDGVVDVTAPAGSGIQVFDNGAGWANPTAIARVAGTDVIQIRRIGSCQRKLTGNMTANNANIQIGSNPCGWKADQILVIADCANVDIFAATNVSTGSVTIAHANSKNTDEKLAKAYGTEAIVFAYGEKHFFVGIHPTLNQPMLYEVTYNGATAVASDIAGNVYDLQVLSVKTDTDGDGAADGEINVNEADDNEDGLYHYLGRDRSQASPTLKNVADWSQVVGIRVGFSVRSEADNTGPESKEYMFNGASVTDRRLWRDFVTNIGIRNRLP